MMEVTMAELRKKLTDTQFRLLMNAQIKYAEVETIAAEAKEHLGMVRVLVLDAHSIPTTALVSIDPKTQELVIEEKDLKNEHK